MLNSNIHKNYRHPHYIAFRNRTPSKDAQGQRYSSKKKGETFHQGDNVTAAVYSKRKGSSSTYDKSSTQTLTQAGQQCVHPEYLHQQCLIILSNMDRRIRQLTKQVTGLMQIVLKNWNCIIVDEKQQQCIRLLGQKELTAKYNRFKQKINLFRKDAITRSLSTHQLASPNPESVSRGEQVKFPPQLCLFQMNPITLSFKPLMTEKAVQKDEDVNEKTYPLKQKQQYQRTKNSKGEDQSLKHRMNYMSNKAEHFKRKCQKLQEQVQQMRGEKQQLQRINEEVSEQSVRIRAQVLSFRLQLSH